MMDTPDPLVAELAQGIHGNLWNYAVRDEVVAALWSQPDSLARLTAIVRNPQAPTPARFAACEVLFDRHFTFVGDVGAATVADIYCRALADNLAGSGNAWGLLEHADDVGPVGIRLVMLGRAAEPKLRALLADDRPGPRYLGSEEATVGNAKGLRVKDYAAHYLACIAATPNA